MAYRQTMIAISIHPEGQSPIYGEGATHVTVDDDGGGVFLVISQCHDEIKPGEVRMDMDELEAVLVAARKLMAEQPGEQHD